MNNRVLDLFSAEVVQLSTLFESRMVCAFFVYEQYPDQDKWYHTHRSSCNFLQDLNKLLCRNLHRKVVAVRSVPARMLFYF